MMHIDNFEQIFRQQTSQVWTRSGRMSVSGHDLFTFNNNEISEGPEDLGKDAERCKAFVSRWILDNHEGFAVQAGIVTGGVYSESELAKRTSAFANLTDTT